MKNINEKMEEVERRISLLEYYIDDVIIEYLTDSSKEMKGYYEALIDELSENIELRNELNNSLKA